MKQLTLNILLAVAAIVLLILPVYVGKPLLDCYIINGFSLALNAYMIAAHYRFTKRAKEAMLKQERTR